MKSILDIIILNKIKLIKFFFFIFEIKEKCIFYFIFIFEMRGSSVLLGNYLIFYMKFNKLMIFFNICHKTVTVI